MAMDESCATSLSENAAMICDSHQRIQDGQWHISPYMSNRNESMDKKSSDLERTHSGKFRVLRKHALDSKYGEFDLNVCDRTLKHKKKFYDIRRYVKESTRRVDGLWMLPKWLGKKVRWKIWTQFTKKNGQERRGLTRNKFTLVLERHHNGDLKQRRKIHSYGKTVGRYKIEKNSRPLRHEWNTQMNTQNNQFDTRRNLRKGRGRETAVKFLGLVIKKKEGVCIALWKHILNEFRHRNQSYICTDSNHLRCTVDKGTYLKMS